MNNRFRKIFGKKFFTKYRFVIMNDNTFEERVSFRLSRMNVFVIGSSVTFLLIVLTVIIIAFTSLREYIPGYSNVEDRAKLYRLSIQADSVKNMLSVTSSYLDSLLIVLSGSNSIQKIDQKEFSRYVSKNEEANSERTVTPVLNTQNAEMTFYKPVEGVVTQGFIPAINHLGIDIVTPVESPVLSIKEGTVILARWSYQFGNMLIIQHPGNIVSVYKHNSILLKKEGEFVHAGEVVAVSGNTGEISSGPHLHIEIWVNGVPVNPALFLYY